MIKPRKQQWRDGRIPLRATENGDFVIDMEQLLGNETPMITAPQLVHLAEEEPRINNQYQLFPVFDAKNGMSIGKMTAKDFLRKIL